MLSKNIPRCAAKRVVLVADAVLIRDVKVFIVVLRVGGGGGLEVKAS
jgi:hypothetical protein